MTTRRFSTAFITLLAALLTTAGLAVALAGPAQAHSELISSSPADGDQVDAPPGEVTLEFNEDIQDIGNEIVITGPDGADVVDGSPQVDGPTVTQALAAPADPAGTYTVTWRVVSADGHPISGEFTFEVLASAVEDTVIEDPTTDEVTTEATETTTEDIAPINETSAADADTEGDSSASLPIIIGLVVVVLVTIAILVVRRRRAR